MYQACISMYLTCISMYLFFRAKGHIHNVCIKACSRHVSTCIHVSACIHVHVSACINLTTYYGATLCTRQMPTMREGGNSKELKRGLSSPQHTSPPQQRTSSLTTT